MPNNAFSPLPTSPSPISLVSIEAEAPADSPAIEALLDEAFGADRHKKQSYRFRQHVGPVEALSLVARDRGRVRRHHPAMAGRHHRCAAEPRSCLLGPIGVAADRRKERIGDRLMRESLRWPTSWASPSSCWWASSATTDASVSAPPPPMGSSCRGKIRAGCRCWSSTGGARGRLGRSLARPAQAGQGPALRHLTACPRGGATAPPPVSTSARAEPAAPSRQCIARRTGFRGGRDKAASSPGAEKFRHPRGIY